VTEFLGAAHARVVHRVVFTVYSAK